MLRILTGPSDIQMCYPHQASFIRQYVLVMYFILSLFCRLQSLRILLRKRKRMLKHFSNSSLLQNPVIFVRHYSMYQPITDLTEGCLGQSVCVQNGKVCQGCLFQCVLQEKALSFFPLYGMIVHCWLPPLKTVFCISPLLCWYPFIRQCKV